MKTNTNSYTIIYSVVLVVVVALMLASVYQALKPQQDANVMLDTQKQILYALNQDRDMTNEEAAKLWQNLVEADDMIDANGNVVEAGKQGGTEAGFQHLNSAEAKDGKLVVFRCKVDGETKYVIPVYGKSPSMATASGAPSAVSSPSMATRRPSLAPTSTMRARLPAWVPRSRTTRSGRTCSRARSSSPTATATTSLSPWRRRSPTPRRRWTA